MSLHRAAFKPRTCESLVRDGTGREWKTRRCSRAEVGAPSRFLYQHPAGGINARIIDTSPAPGVLQMRERGGALRHRPSALSGLGPYALRTFAACRPFGPRTMSNSSRSPSASVLKPSPVIAE